MAIKVNSHKTYMYKHRYVTINRFGKSKRHDSADSLHFPPGKTDITWMMLDAGAETDVVNSVGRTAAQMAAFVG